MKANELMIGDWVHVEAHRGFNAQNVKVETISDNDGDNEYGHHYGHIGTWLDGGDNDFRDVEAKHIQPIPLSQEILEKNEFEKSYSCILTADGYKKLAQYKYKNMTQAQDICRNLITISYSDLKGGVYDIQCGIGSHIYDLKYVHELQHALRLCGISKKIQL